MSDDVLKVIPIEPRQIPAEDTHRSAVEFLETRFPDREMCEAKVFDEVNFIDCGEILEAVICPECQEHVSLDPFVGGDAGPAWWHAIQEKLERCPVEEMQVTMPCCNASVAFTSLAFDWPAGFARFELSIWNPNESENLNERELSLLGDLLRCELTQVRAHY